MLKAEFRLRREGEALILQSRHKARWLGVLIVGFALVWIAVWIRDSQGWLDLWIGRLAGVAFIGMGVFLLLPYEVTTVFDLRSRRVLRNVNVCHGWYERRRTYAFDEIAGLGLQEDRTSYGCMPVMTLRNGKTLWLTTASGSYESYAMTIDDVCAATGLQRRDVPYGVWWMN